MLHDFTNWLNENYSSDFEERLTTRAISVFSKMFKDITEEASYFSYRMTDTLTGKTDMVFTIYHDLGDEQDLDYDLNQTTTLLCKPIFTDYDSEEAKVVLLGSQSSPEVILDLVKGFNIQLTVSLSSSDIYRLEYSETSSFEILFEEGLEPKEKVEDLIDQFESIDTEEYLRKDQVEEIMSEYLSNDDDEEYGEEE